MALSGSAMVDRHIDTLKQKLMNKSMSLMHAFHKADADNSQQLSSSELAACLKEVGVTLPPQVLAAVVARFDANGDGYVSIPEFMSFMSGRDNREELRHATAHVEEEVEGSRGRPSLRPQIPLVQLQQTPRRPLDPMSAAFLGRMEEDIETRRMACLINEYQSEAAPREPATPRTWRDPPAAAFTPLSSPRSELVYPPAEGYTSPRGRVVYYRFPPEHTTAPRASRVAPGPPPPTAPALTHGASPRGSPRRSPRRLAPVGFHDRSAVPLGFQVVPNYDDHQLNHEELNYLKVRTTSPGFNGFEGSPFGRKFKWGALGGYY